MILPGVVLVLALLFSTVLIQSETYFYFLFLSPPFLYALTGPFFGQSFLSEAVSASMIDRLKFMTCFGIPAFVSCLGIIRQRADFHIQTTDKLSTSRQVIIYLISVLLFLDLISIYLNRPINGVGQSIYVPIFSVIVSFLLLATALQIPAKLRNFQKAADSVIFTLFLFLFFNTIFPMIQWNQELDRSLIFSEDEYRFSPFSELLNLPGRQSFFTTDPETFAVFSFVCFAIILSSRNTVMRFLSSSLVLVIGSTTQSRLFYLGVIIATFLYICDKALSASRVFRTSVLSVFMGLSFFLVFFWASSPRTGLASFTGRTYIWRIVLDNLNPERSLTGALLGTFGNFSLTKFSEEQGAALIFYHAHNFFLDYLWNWGILGLTLIVALVLACARLAVLGERSSFIVFSSLLFAGLIEPTFSLSLKSFEFFALVVFFSSWQTVEKDSNFSSGKV
jgi:hypothetical protein